LSERRDLLPSHHQRRIGQASLAEALLPAGAGSNRRLQSISSLIDWAPMERLLAPLRAPTGRPGYPPLALFRALLLAQWYQFSDPGIEAAVFMDKAYERAGRREALAEAGIVNGIMHRAHARRPLTAWQRWMNADWRRSAATSSAPSVPSSAGTASAACATAAC
jgi:hypothetical protein